MPTTPAATHRSISPRSARSAAMPGRRAHHAVTAVAAPVSTTGTSCHAPSVCLSRSNSTPVPRRPIARMASNARRSTGSRDRSLTRSMTQEAGKTLSGRRRRMSRYDALSEVPRPMYNRRRVEPLEGMAYHIECRVLPLHVPMHDHELRMLHHFFVGCDIVLAHHHVDEPVLVLEEQEQRALGGVRALADHYEPRHGDIAPMRDARELATVLHAARLESGTVLHHRVAVDRDAGGVVVELNELVAREPRALHHVGDGSERRGHLRGSQRFQRALRESAHEPPAHAQRGVRRMRAPW